MRICALVQARYASTRLPGKVLMPLAGVPVLRRIYDRLLTCREVDQVVVSIGNGEGAEKIVEFCEREGMYYSLGDENDLIARHRKACEYACADAFVRITSDCPLVDRAIVDQCCMVLRDEYAGGVDFVSNTIKRTYPDGLDVEVMTLRLLAELDRTPGYERESFCRHFIQHGDESRMMAVTYPSEDLSDVRLVLDTEDDKGKLECLIEKAGDTHWSAYASKYLALGYPRVPCKDHITRAVKA